MFMRRALRCLLGIGLLGATGVTSAAQSEPFPDWAYPPCIRAAAATPVDGVAQLQVPGSSLRFTAANIANTAVAPDWFPREHSPLPAELAASRSDKFACAYCHLPDGSGRPENAKLAGLSRSYIFAQVRALHFGERQPGKSGWPPTTLMRGSVADLTDTQVLAAAEYFSQQKNVSFVRVLEREFAPAHKIACGIYVPDTGRSSPLKHRIIEMPIEARRFEARDPHTEYIAYVPTGSIERGRKLASSGDNGRTQPCADCHGADLRSGPDLEGPALAGRFATYLFRQLFGFQSGARAGDIARPMQAVVAQLTQADMIDLAAYAASMKP
jgi:cytochrome c553